MLAFRVYSNRRTQVKDIGIVV